MSVRTHGMLCGYPGRDCICEDIRRNRYLLFVTIGIACMQLLGGYFTRALSLYADTGHVASDAVAILVYITAIFLINYGLNKRVSTLWGTRVLIVLLILVAIGITHEAFERLGNQEHIYGLPLIGIALLGAFGNLWQERIHASAPGHKHDSMHKGLLVHIKSDFWQSIGVAVGGFLIFLTGIREIDLGISLLISLWILWQAYLLAFAPEKSHLKSHIDGSDCHHDHHH